MNKKISYAIVFCLALIFLACGMPAGAATWHVAPTGDDDGDGAQWATALATISNAVFKAGASVGDLILVSNGTYDLSGNEVVITNAVTVRSWNNGVVDMAGTIVDGNGLSRCFALSHSNVLLEGLTIRNGSNALAGGGVLIDGGGTLSNCLLIANCAAEGGGVYMTNGGLITASTVRENSSFTNPAGLSRGGGIFIIRSGTVSNCVVAANTVDSQANNGWIYSGGGGIGVHVAGAEDQCRIHACWITNNSSEWYGGGINVYQSLGGVSQVVISGSTVADNRAFHSGAGMYFNYGPPAAVGLVTGCVITGNAITGYIGVATANLGVGGGLGSYYNSIEVRNSLISGNTGNNGGGGACLRIFDSVVESNTAHCRGGGMFYVTQTDYEHMLADCTVRGNNCYSNGLTGSGNGGGICVYYGGGARGVIRNSKIYENYAQKRGGGIDLGIVNYNPMTGQVYNCLIYNNVGDESGGVHLGGTGFIATASTIVSNYSRIRGGGAGLMNGDITNCIVYYNSGAATSPDIYFGAGCTNKIFYCCAPTNVTPWQGNITNAPEFINFAAQEFQLAGNSPCINAGTNEAWMVGARDLDGLSRIDRFSRRVDMGAYERTPSGVMFVVQ